MGNNRNRRDDSGMGCLIYAFIGIVAMPLVGLYFLFSGEEDKKGLGVALLVIGILIWLYIGLK